MASIHTLYDADGGVRGYKVRFRTMAGAERAQTFRLAREARAFAAETEASRSAGRLTDPRLGRETVRAYGERWRATLIHRPRTASGVEQTMRLHVYPVLGGHAMRAVRESDIRGWLKGQLHTSAPTTVATRYAWLRALFRAAVGDGLLPASPCDRLAGPSPRRRDLLLPTVEEVETIAAALPARWAAIAPLGAQTGLRPSELLGLTVDRVDFLRQTITVDRQAQGGALVPPKTRRSYRSVPVDVVTVELLAAHLAARGPGDEGAIFHRADGRLLSHGAVGGTWKRVVARTVGRPIRLHDLRHHYASELVAGGIDLVTVAALIGDTVAETSKTYAHLVAGHEDRTRRAVAGKWRNRVSSACPGDQGATP